MNTRLAKWTAIVALWALLCVRIGSHAKSVIREQKLSSDEFVELSEKLRNTKSERYRPPEGPFNEEDGIKARERLVAEQKRIIEAEARAAEALAKWNSLTDEEKEKVVKEATERAQKKAAEIQKDVELSEKLMQKEAADLEDQLDEQFRKEEENDKQQVLKDAQKERDEYIVKRDAHRARMHQERTTTRSLVFLTCTFLLSFSLSSIALRIRG